MKITLPFLSFLIVQLLVAQQTQRVLFIGNSYTYSNNLPNLVASMAAADGNLIVHESNTPGGYTFQNHISNAATLSKIQQGNWDYVVLQEQSQIPAFPINYVETNCFPFATSLNNLIVQHNPCAETIFYMTWGRENGDTQNCPTYPPVCTYEGMDDLLKARYLTMTTTNQAIVAPVGALWRHLRTNYPSVNLYSSDGSHPSLAGTYAAACAFYTAIFRANPQNNTYNPGLPLETLSTIRNAAKAIIYDNLINWNIGNYDPNASFSFSNTTNLTYQFINLSSNATSYLWSFGDGTTSTLANPEHTYTQNGNYIVTLNSYKCNQMAHDEQSIHTLSLPNLEHNSPEISIFPNPCFETFTILSTAAIINVSLYNTIGACALTTQTVHQNKINVAHLPRGIYILKINSKNGVYVQKIVLN